MIEGVARARGGPRSIVLRCRRRGFPGGGWCDEAVTGSWHRGPDPGIGRRRGAGRSGALEGPDDNHAATATGAWRAMVGCGAGGWVRLVALRRRIGPRRPPQGGADRGACAL